MNRTQLIKLCDALVLALLVGIFSSFSWVAGVVVAVLGLLLGFVFRPRNYPSSHQKYEGSADRHALDDEEEDWWFYWRRHR